MEETRWEGRNVSEVVTPQEQEGFWVQWILSFDTGAEV
jgi:hypothetical protein